MGDHDHGSTGFVEPPDQVQYGDLAVIVQPGRRFIQDQDFGVRGQHRSHRQLLSFAACQVEGIFEFSAGESGFGQGRRDLLPDFFFGKAVVADAEGDFVQHGVSENLVIRVLEHVSDTASQFGQGPVGGGFAQDLDLAFSRRVQSVEVLGERRLPAAVLPDQGNEFAGSDVQGNPVHGRRRRSVTEDQVPDADDRLALFPLPIAVQPIPGGFPDAPSGRTDARRGVPDGQRIGLKPQFGQQHGSLQRADAMPFHAMGIGQNLTGRPIEDDTPFVHQQDPVRGQDVLGLVLDQDDPFHFIPEDLRELEDVSLAHGVQVGRRFVHDDQRGSAREYRRNGQALFFAARQAGGVPLLEARESHHGQGLFDAGPHPAAVHGEVFEGESGFQFHVCGEQLRLEVLEDQAHDPCQFVDMGMAGLRSPGYLQTAFEPALDEGRDQSVQATAQGGLARAGLADDDRELAVPMTVADLVERRFRRVAVGEREVAEREDRLIQETR